jgi:uncharacterized protein (UPF0276 family)
MRKPALGFGLGLRTDHYDHIVEHQPDIDWFEALSENYMVAGGKPKYYLHRIRDRYPVVLHGVSLSIGSSDPLNLAYIKSLSDLIDEVEPKWISDHLCWTSAGGINSHDLMPLPYTEEAISHVADRIMRVQDMLQQRMLIENVSSYVNYEHSQMEEWAFYAEVVNRADCLMLLDINNIYVSARNHHFDPVEYLDAIDPERVQQIHLAGHTDNTDHVIDTHDQDVHSEVWDLYRAALSRFGAISTMIERDDNIPPFEELEAELNIARMHANEVLKPGTPHARQDKPAC